MPENDFLAETKQFYLYWAAIEIESGIKIGFEKEMK